VSLSVVQLTEIYLLLDSVPKPILMVIRRNTGDPTPKASGGSKKSTFTKYLIMAGIAAGSIATVVFVCMAINRTRYDTPSKGSVRSKAVRSKVHELQNASLFKVSADVFVSFSGNGDEDIASEVITQLQGQGLKCATTQPVGAHSDSMTISQGMYTCKVAVIILPHQSLEKIKGYNAQFQDTPQWFRELEYAATQSAAGTLGVVIIVIADEDDDDNLQSLGVNIQLIPTICTRYAPDRSVQDTMRQLLRNPTIITNENEWELSCAQLVAIVQNHLSQNLQPPNAPPMHAADLYSTSQPNSTTQSNFGSELQLKTSPTPSMLLASGFDTRHSQPPMMNLNGSGPISISAFSPLASPHFSQVPVTAMPFPIHQQDPSYVSHPMPMPMLPHLPPQQPSLQSRQPQIIPYSPSHALPPALSPAHMILPEHITPSDTFARSQSPSRILIAPPNQLGRLELRDQWISSAPTMLPSNAVLPSNAIVSSSPVLLANADLPSNAIPQMRGHSPSRMPANYHPPPTLLRDQSPSRMNPMSSPSRFPPAPIRLPSNAVPVDPVTVVRSQSPSRMPAQPLTQMTPQRAQTPRPSESDTFDYVEPPRVPPTVNSKSQTRIRDDSNNDPLSMTQIPHSQAAHDIQALDNLMKMAHVLSSNYSSNPEEYLHSGLRCDLGQNLNGMYPSNQSAHSLPTQNGSAPDRSSKSPSRLRGGSPSRVRLHE
jgi:hypothetical protein